MMHGTTNIRCFLLVVLKEYITMHGTLDVEVHFTLRMAILNIRLILHYKDRQKINGFIRSWVAELRRKLHNLSSHNLSSYTIIKSIK